MDGLVSRKFDFKRKEIIEKRDKEFVSLQHNFNSRGTMNSGVFIKAAFGFLYKVAVEIVDALLETYEEVEETTNENIIVGKSGEILDETIELAYREARRAYEIISDMTKKQGFPPLPTLLFFLQI